jgi:hypothetical protein
VSAEQIELSAEERQKAENRELAQKWLAEIDRVRNRESKWREKSKKVLARYRDSRGVEDDTTSRFNILWSNTETIKPAIFARMPVPDVRRRYTTKDPAARTASLILERCLAFSNASYDFKDTLDRANEDYVLPGRSVALVCYEPIILQKRKAVEPLPPSDSDDKKYPEGTEFDAQGPYQMQPYKAWESVYCQYVSWELFGFSECSQWAKVPAVWIGEYMSKDEVREFAPQFTDVDGLSFSQVAVDSDDTKGTQPPATVLVWKVWHKAARKFMAFAEKYPEGPLKIEDDPQQLENFYPLPEPMYSLRTNGNWLPQPEFLQYQDQANELDDITNRLKNLINACKNRGVYDSAMDELAKISELPKKPDNTYIPVPDFRTLMEKGGIENLISTMPLKNIIECIQQLRERQLELKEEIYEIYGISDIMRGSTHASETLGAQKLKAQYGGLRISTRQERFQKFVRDIFQLQAEIIAEHFSPDTLRLMSGIQVVPDQVIAQLKQQNKLEVGMVSESEFAQAIQILRSDKLRGFKVDVETDSTIPVDKDGEQQNRVAFIQAIGQFLQGIIPAIQMGAVPIPMAREALLFVVRGFKVGSELEEVLEELGNDPNENSGAQLQQLQQMVEQMKQQMGELSQENQQLKSGAQVEMQKAEIKAQSDQQNTQSQLQVQDAQHLREQQLAAQVAAREQAAQDAEAARQMQLEQWKIESAERMHQMDLENERMIADAKNQTAIQVAEISAASAANAQATPAADYKPTEDLTPVIKELVQQLAKPKIVVRDAMGQVTGVQ